MKVLSRRLRKTVATARTKARAPSQLSPIISFVVLAANDPLPKEIRLGEYKTSKRVRIMLMSIVSDTGNGLDNYKSRLPSDLNVWNQT